MRLRGWKRGFAMALTLIIVALVAIVTFTSVNVSTLDQRSSTQDIIAAQAGYAARAGISQTQKTVGRPIKNTLWGGTEAGGNPDAPFPSTPEVDLGDGIGYSVRVRYDGSSNWKITSRGYYRGATRTLVAFAQAVPFAKYAYFTDRDVSTSGSEIWFTTDNVITGPAHTNGHFRFAGQPQWASSVTTSNLSDPRYNLNNNTYNQSGIQDDPSKFYQHYSSYNNDFPRAAPQSTDFSFSGGHEEIPMPQTSADISQAASNEGHAYTSNSHNYNSNSEYQIAVDEANTSGRVTAVQRKSGGSFNNVSETSAPPVYKLEFTDDGQAQLYKKRVGSSTTWDAEGSPISTEPSATIHVDGFLLMKGTVRGRVTVGATQDIHNIDNLVYADTTRDVLGVVADKNFIVQSNKNQNRNRNIHASIMTLNGSFTVDEYNSGGFRGDLYVLGGIIQYRRGPVGTFRYSNGVPTPSTGYEKNYVFDQKLRSKPPLHFPTTGEVEMRAMIDQGAPGGL